MKEKATYHKQSMEEFTGNPLIEALPPLDDPVLYPKLLLVQPPYSPDDRKLNASLRLIRLQRLSQLHVPTREDSMLLGISRCLHWGYAGRNPLPFETVKTVLEEEGVCVTEELEKYLRSVNAPIYGFPVLGVSGVGKTTSIENVLSLFPQVILHSSYHGVSFECEQLVWLKVDCPGDGAPKSLCSAILRGIDDVLKAQYAQQIIRNRMSKDVLLIRVSQLIQSLHLGILVIDDIQNLCSAKGTITNELLSFMISLANSLKIPVVMVGSPKILTLLQKEFQQAKRASGEGEIRMDLMEKGSAEWERFIKVLWRYQYTGQVVDLTEKMEQVFFEESVGNPFIAATLYKLVQDEAIISRKEKFTVQDVRRISREKMGITAAMRRNMLNGVDVELNRYRHLWAASAVDQDQGPAGSEMKTVSRTWSSDTFLQLVAVLEEKGLSAKDARLSARQAMAAYPQETDVKVLLGYAQEVIRSRP